jgi:hypothetical protein
MASIFILAVQVRNLAMHHRPTAHVCEVCIGSAEMLPPFVGEFLNDRPDPTWEIAFLQAYLSHEPHVQECQNSGRLGTHNHAPFGPQGDSSGDGVPDPPGIVIQAHDVFVEHDLPEDLQYLL